MNEAHLELLRVLLSAPPMTVLVVLVLVWVFRSDLKATMSRIATIKFPGGELSTTSQADRSEKTVPPDEPQQGLQRPLCLKILRSHRSSKSW